MAKFLNIDPNPQEIESKSKGTTGAPAEAVPQPLDWDETQDQGLKAQERTESRALATADTITKQESFEAGAGTSIVAAAIRKASHPDFELDPNFNIVTALQTDPSVLPMKLTEEEVKYMRDSVSALDYQYRIQEVRADRIRMQEFSANPISGFAGAVVGDSPTIILPYAAAGVGSKMFMMRNLIRTADIGLTAYASDQIGQSDLNTAIVASVAGLDAFFDTRRALKSLNLAEKVTGTIETGGVSTAGKVFDDLAPTRPAAQPVEVQPVKPTIAEPVATKVSVKDSRTKPLPNPMQVGAGSKGSVNTNSDMLIRALQNNPITTASNQLILKQLKKVLHKVPVSISTDTSVRSNYKVESKLKTGEIVKEVITLRPSIKASGQVWKSTKDAFAAIDDSTAGIAVHELIHAATSNVIDRVQRGILPATSKEAKAVKNLEDLRKKLHSIAGAKYRYQLQSVHEMVAALGDNTDDFIKFLDSVKLDGKETALRQFARKIMEVLGFTGTDTALAKVLDSMETLIKSRSVKDVPSMRSKGMQDAMKDISTHNEAEQAKSMLKGIRGKFAANFALYDNIAQGNKELADLLVSDATSRVGRQPSVADYKRNLELEFVGRAYEVENTIVQNLQRQGIKKMDMFFNRQKFIQARKATEEKVTKYLDAAYDAELQGLPIPEVPHDVADIVKAFRDSGWSEGWYDTITKSGMVDHDAFRKSKNYIPRRYSPNKVSEMYQSGWNRDQLRKGLGKVLADTYPAMSKETVRKVSDNMLRGIEAGGMNKSDWRSMVASVSDDELIMAMRNSGIDDASIQKFLAENQHVQSGLGSSSTVFKSRSRFNMTKEYTVDGKTFKMSDIMETNISGLMQGYTNRMSGRVGMQMAGVGSITNLAKMIDESALNAPRPDLWRKTMDDTVTHLLGGFSGEQAPEFMRAAGNFASATMLKNSGLYQITDTALAMKEFGMARVLQSLVKEPWFKEMKVIGESKDLSSRLDSILRGGVQKDTKFRFLHTYADDNYDLMSAGSLYNVSQNLGQGAQYANGMHHIHRMQVNMNAGIIADELKQMLKGDSKAFKRLQEFGLDLDDAKAMQEAYKKGGDNSLLPFELQMKLEVVGVRAMDYVVQQIRTGETSAFAQFSGIGKAIVGYQSFVLAATNKILRRHTSNGDYGGLVLLMAHQYPLMIMMTAAKYGLDGTTNEKSTGDWIADSVFGMSALGGISMIQDVFGSNEARHSVPALAFVTNSVNTIKKIMATDSEVTPQDVSRILPYMQEFMVTRALINNFGD